VAEPTAITSPCESRMGSSGARWPLTATTVCAECGRTVATPSSPTVKVKCRGASPWFCMRHRTRGPLPTSVSPVRSSRVLPAKSMKGTGKI
jgi:hypothetical protein